MLWSMCMYIYISSKNLLYYSIHTYIHTYIIQTYSSIFCHLPLFFWLTAPTNSGVRAANLFELLCSGHGDASLWSWPTNLVILRHGSPWYPGGFKAPNIYLNMI